MVDASQSRVIKQVLRAAVDGPFFPDWEFHTLFGFERDEMRRIAEHWPNWPNEVEQHDAVNGAFNMLLGYPHRRWDVWHEYITPVSAELARIYAEWRGEDELEGSAKGVFDRLT